MEQDDNDSSIDTDHSCGGSVDDKSIDSSIQSGPETDNEDTLHDSGVDCQAHHKLPPTAEVNSTSLLASVQWGHVTTLIVRSYKTNYKTRYATPALRYPYSLPTTFNT